MSYACATMAGFFAANFIAENRDGPKVGSAFLAVISGIAGVIAVANGL